MNYGESPSSKPEVEPAKVASPVATQTVGTVLFAEDEPVLRELGTQVLEKAGYEVHSTDDGSEALDILRGEADRIGLVVLDWKLPGHAGSELLRSMYAIRSDLSVLIATGGGGEGLKALRPPEGGRLRLLKKPFRSYELLATAASMFAEREKLSHSLRD